MEFFYYLTYLLEIQESELREKLFLIPPCLIVYFAKTKFLEMSLDLLGENLLQVLKKIESNFNLDSKKGKKMTETSNITNTTANLLENKKIEMDQINEKYFKLIERMLKGKYIIEREYFYLKSLFFQDIQLILNHCLESLM